MSDTPVEKLKTWFDSLPLYQQREVVQFLYGGKMMLNEGLYTGPVPGMVTRGLHCGPAPEEGSSRCHACGRPF
jgi:hypothetical protein